jgi:beta-lactamase class A
VIAGRAAEIGAAAAAAGLGEAAIHLISLDGSGARLAVDTVEDISPASMIKTPLAVAVAVAVDAGRIGWTDRIAVDDANMTVNDAPSPLLPGASATIRELVELMISRSDNVATNILIDRVGREHATRDLAALGFAHTAIRRKLSGALPLIDDPQADGRNAHPARRGHPLGA